MNWFPSSAKHSYILNSRHNANWLFSFYIAGYELQDKDRAECGVKLYKEIIKREEKNGIRQILEDDIFLIGIFIHQIKRTHVF